jgi:hypothetical protein
MLCYHKHFCLVVWIATSTPKNFQKTFFFLNLIEEIHIDMESFDSFNVGLQGEWYEEFCFWDNHGIF